MRYAILCFSFLILSPLWVCAQQEAHYSQYLLNYYLVNPALAGSEAPFNIMMGHRNQWTGMQDAPQTYWLSVNKAINYPSARVRQRRGHHGIGGLVLTDRAGPFRYTQAHLSYAYHLPLSKTYTASLGVSAGMKQLALDKEQVIFVQNPNDSYFNTYSDRQLDPDAQVGLWVYSDRLFTGLSAHQLLSARNASNADADAATLASHYHYYATLGYRIPIDQDLSFIPSLMVKSAYPSPVQVDVNMKLRYRQHIWGGVSYRHQDAITVLMGAILRDKFLISYAYDVSTTRLRHSSRGSHEIVLGLKLPPRGKVVCPDQFW